MIYENVKALCDKKHITIAELERNAGLTNGTIGKWRKAKPRIDSLQAVANYFGVTVTRLIR